MKRVTKKTAPTRTKKKSLLSKMRRSRGAVDAGTIYAIIFLGIVVGGGAMMIGNTSPKLSQPDESQPVIILPGNNTKNPNLQLEDFPGITLTPTPSPSPTPTPTPPPPPPASGSGGGGGGGSSCFVAGTQILMADGTEKDIEDVKVGEKVMGYDGKKQVAVTVQELEAPVRDHHYNVTLEDGTVIGVTNEHPLYTLNGWKSISPEETAEENPQLKVKSLKVGDKVLQDSGEYAAIVDMDRVSGSVQVYNLKKVSGFNNFYADGVLAHNKGGGGGGGPSGGSAL